MVTTDMQNNDEQLLDQFINELPAFEERLMNEKFRNTCKQICTGNAWYKKVLAYYNKKNFSSCSEKLSPIPSDVRAQTKKATKTYHLRQQNI